MHHGYFKDRISAYHDGDLRPEEMELISRHLESCEECRKLLVELEKFDSLVEEHSGLAGDEYFEESARKIESLIAPEQKPEIIEIKRPFWHGLGWKVAAAAASFAVIGFIGLHQSDIMEQVQDRAVAPAEKVPAVSMADTGRMEPVKAEPVEEAEVLQPEAESRRGVAEKSVGLPSSVPTKGVRKATKAEPTKMAAADVGGTGRDVVSDDEATPDAGIVQPVEIPAETTKAVTEERVESFSLKLAESAEETARRDKKAKMHPVPPVDSPAAIVRQESIIQVQGLMAESDAISAARGDSVSKPSRTLEEWRRTKDSCQVELDRLAAIGKGAKRVRLSESDKDVREQIEKTLLDACYNIGLLTDDQSEFEKAVGCIRDYTGVEGASHVELARQYLEKLTSQKRE